MRKKLWVGVVLAICLLGLQGGAAAKWEMSFDGVYQTIDSIDMFGIEVAEDWSYQEKDLSNFIGGFAELHPYNGRVTAAPKFDDGSSLGVGMIHWFDTLGLGFEFRNESFGTNSRTLEVRVGDEWRTAWEGQTSLGTWSALVSLKVPLIGFLTIGAGVGCLQVRNEGELSFYNFPLDRLFFVGDSGGGTTYVKGASDLVAMDGGGCPKEETGYFRSVTTYQWKPVVPTYTIRLDLEYPLNDGWCIFGRAGYRWAEASSEVISGRYTRYERQSLDDGWTKIDTDTVQLLMPEPDLSGVFIGAGITHSF